MSEAKANYGSPDHKNWDDSALKNDAFSTASIDQENAFASNAVRKLSNSDLSIVSVLTMLSSVGFGIHALGYLCRRHAQGTTKPRIGNAIEAAYSNRMFVNQKSEASQKESIDQLIVKNSHLKRDAINRYEHDINLLTDEVVAAVKCFRKSTEQQLFSELVTPDFTGFRKPEKMEKFNQDILQPMSNKESSMLQKKIVSLGGRFRQAELRLEKDFEQILEILKRDCSGLDISLPDIRALEPESKNPTAQLLAAAKKRGRYAAAEVALINTLMT